MFRGGISRDLRGRRARPHVHRSLDADHGHFLAALAGGGGNGPIPSILLDNNVDPHPNELRLPTRPFAGGACAEAQPEMYCRCATPARKQGRSQHLRNHRC